MEFWKREPNILAVLHRDSGRRFSFKFGVITIAFIAFWPHCEAQCSTPSEQFTASTNPQLLYSPNYPNPYLEETRCSWLITSPIATGKIQLRVVHDNFSCCCDNDYLLIRDGSDPSAMPIAILCSDLNPISITSSGPVIYGEFRSDSDGQTGLGYKLQFDYFDSNASCPSGWIEREGYCYKLYDEALPWQQAASRCGYDGGFLTSIVDEEENNFLVDSFQGQSSVAWIGMNSTGNWLDCSISSLYNFENDSSSISMGCAIMDLDDGGRWRVEDCSNQSLNFICKKTRDGDGGRYWTEITLNKEKESSSHPLSSDITFWLVYTLSCFLLVCYSYVGVKLEKYHHDHEYDRRVKLIYYLWCGPCMVIQWCLFFFLCCGGKFEEERSSGTPSNSTSAHQQDVSVETVQISRRRLAVRPSFPPPPPPPPPPYTEALDARYDVRSTDINGGSCVVLNMHEAIAPPSYESVTGSAWE